MIERSDILAALFGIVAITALVAFVTLRQRLARVSTEFEQQTQAILAMQGAIKVLSGEAIGHRQDLAALRQAIDRLIELHHESRLETRLRDADSSPYSQAIALIRHGQSRDEVRKLCSLTESEVDLLFSLHGQGVGSGMRTPDRRLEPESRHELEQRLRRLHEQELRNLNQFGELPPTRFDDDPPSRFDVPEDDNWTPPNRR
ncbi:DUF2802 domain-containing protein [Thiospirillum jenense]|uniref:DUF2802 domain-containing protein n=1 Tax=Thiospirillum jenense TaxID=1653858 RepID=A0A839HF41_9GAMM|nr:DUF2802 domain-containing protein [Thiospirillum jenense]MBB1125787.1 DUF2802 domain-containing protein [Thiospirillum jenense]